MRTPTTSPEPRQQFVSNIKVVYTLYPESRPDYRLKDVLGGSSDVNYGYDGKRAYLVPEYTDDPDKACIGFEAVVTDTEAPLLNSLAGGGRGRFRYLIPVRDNGSNKKVVEVGLMRLKSSSGSSEVALEQKFDAMTRDLNKQRGGDWLYVVYKLEEVRYAGVEAEKI